MANLKTFKTKSLFEKMHLCYNSQKILTIEEINDSKLISFNLMVPTYLVYGEVSFDFKSMAVRLNDSMSKLVQFDYLKENSQMESLVINDVVFSENSINVNCGFEGMSFYLVQLNKDGLILTFIGNTSSKHFFPYSSKWIITIT